MNLVCIIPVIGSLFSGCQPAAHMAVGYVEGDFVLIAPIETAQVETVHVRRGDRIAPNEPLAELERRDAELAVRKSRAALAEAESKLADLKRGKRPEEIDAIKASIDSAKAEAIDAERTLLRQADLLQRETIAQAAYDSAQTAVDQAKAKVSELEANLAVARLPARVEQIKAAEAAVDQARGALEDAEWRLGKRTLSSPKPGLVFDIIRNPGEIAGPQAPVVSVLPDGAVKLRVYVPEAELSQLKPGTRLDVQCDGCPSGLTATVNYIASEAEFTPPVLYSINNRQKLVYMVEARPDGTGYSLKPGQIVDVDLAADPQ